MKKELILNLLNLSNNYNLIDVREEEVRGKVALVIDVDFNMKRIRRDVKCPVCGNCNISIHERKKKKRLILHLILPDGRRIYLRLPRIRFRCKECNKTFSYYPEGIHPWMRISDNLLLTSIYNLRRGSFREVSSFIGIHTRTLKRYIDRFMRNSIPWEYFDGMSDIRIGIDEHSMRGKRNKVTLVVELNSHTPITILPSDKKEEIVRFLNSIPLHVKRKIREVSIDMRESFRRGIRESLGSNVRIVVDPFHVIRDANRRIDEERKLIQSTHLYYKGKRIKIPKILFLKGREKLTDEERDKIDYYFNLYPSLKEFYEIKERLRYMFKYMKHKDIEVIRKYINNLIRDIDRSNDPEIRRWSKTLKRWREEIINHFFNLSSTSIVEGYNTLSKLIKRISFGLRDVNTYINKVFLGIVPLNLLPHLLT